MTVGAPLYVLGVRSCSRRSTAKFANATGTPQSAVAVPLRVGDSLTKQDFIDMERRWLFLARGYEFADRLWNFAEPSNRRNRKRIQEVAFGAPFGSHSNQSDLVDQGLAEKECEYAELV